MADARTESTSHETDAHPRPLAPVQPSPWRWLPVKIRILGPSQSPTWNYCEPIGWTPAEPPLVMRDTIFCSLPADADPVDVSKVQHKLENARVKLAKAGTPGKQ